MVIPGKPYKLPDFIGLGPGRTGTTWLHQVLEGQVDLPYGIKETQFFGSFYDKGIDWYGYHFRYATGDRKVAEICPYLTQAQAPERIKLHLPECKFIITLRNPIDHAYSAYKLLIHFVWARGTFEQVLNSRPHLDNGNRYARHLTRWFRTFERDRFLILRYEDLRRDPQRYLNQICEFTSVPRFRLSDRGDIGDDVHAFECAPKSRKLAQNARHVMYWLQSHRAYGVINALERAGVWQFCYGRGEKFPPLSPEQESMLLKRYLPEIEALEDLLKIDLSDWKRPRAPRIAPPIRSDGDAPNLSLAAGIASPGGAGQTNR
ncbi:MAG TPA: sulfotransferase [Candidatus Binataceae bacterium]|nr:sulfotransferase [Candidatus Binataceae bacterium]